jgi:hypothetical protein
LSSDKKLIEAGFYCNSLKSTLTLAAKCVQPCTDDHVDYFGRKQLMGFCESSVNLAPFATISNWSVAQVFYNCSTPPLSCGGLVTTELQRTLDTSPSNALRTATVNMMLLMAVTMLSVMLISG